VFKRRPRIFSATGRSSIALFQGRGPLRVGGMACFAMYHPRPIRPPVMVHVMANAAFTGVRFSCLTVACRAEFRRWRAGELYDSIQKVNPCPEDMRLFMCHDMAQRPRYYSGSTTVGDEKAHNIHVGGGKTRAEFNCLSARERDAQLANAKPDHPVASVNNARRHMPATRMEFNAQVR